MFVLGGKRSFTWKQNISQCLGFDFNAKHIFRKNEAKNNCSGNKNSLTFAHLVM